MQANEPNKVKRNKKKKTEKVLGLNDVLLAA